MEKSLRHAQDLIQLLHAQSRRSVRKTFAHISDQEFGAMRAAFMRQVGSVAVLPRSLRPKASPRVAGEITGWDKSGSGSGSNRTGALRLGITAAQLRCPLVLPLRTPIASALRRKSDAAKLELFTNLGAASFAPWPVSVQPGPKRSLREN